jgi:hypothetical protein
MARYLALLGWESLHVMLQPLTTYHLEEEHHALQKYMFFSHSLASGRDDIARFEDS